MSSPTGFPEEGSGTLNGWKEIAAYIGKSVRSAQRWEADLGLPTRRIKTPDGHIVYAKKADIDKWRASMDARRLDAHLDADEQPASGLPPVSRRPRAGLIRSLWFGAGFVGATLLYVVLAQPFAVTGADSRDDVNLTLVGDVLEARDIAGALHWSHRFTGNVQTASYIWGLRNIASGTLSVAKGDLDGDGSVDEVVPFRIGSPEITKHIKANTLVAFSGRDGRVLWSLTGDRVLACGGTNYSAPWDISAVLASRDDQPRLWVSFHHSIWWPSFVVEVRPDGVQELRYLQAGWINSLEQWTTPTGTWGVAGGVLNEHAKASVVLFDLNGPPSSLRAEESTFSCDTASDLRPPRQVVVLPNFEVPQTLGNSYVAVDRLRVLGEDIVAEIGDMLLATIGPDGQVRDLSSTDSYWFQHLELEKANRLTHAAARCPELSTPKQILSWTQGAEWQQSSIVLKARQRMSQR